ncbi:MAG TPA: hypothetical protein VG889_09915 [Rhizomicrobium sp.]|nr:hypothetical protein [Rhizomicrobium sp.]
MSKTCRLLPEQDDLLSDTRVWLGAIRNRLVNFGLTDALERLERLDDAILQAIIDRVKPETPLTLH